MESCLLCLEVDEDRLNCIKVDSTRWQDLAISKIIKKHFWSLNTIQSSAWICLSCWREVDEFHKFYLRIEEAHVNFGKIKTENDAVSLQCNEDLAIPKTKLKKNGDECDKGSTAYCFLEPEIPIDQIQPLDLAEQEILIEQPPISELLYNKESSVLQVDNKLYLDDMLLKQVSKRLKFQNYLACKDPLEKSKKYHVNKPRKRRNSKSKKSKAEKLTEENKTEHLNVKEEPNDLNDNDSDSVDDTINDVSDCNSQPDKNSPIERKIRRPYGKNRKENDNFIAEHFKQMSCDICQIPFKDFSDMQKHFTNTHKQRGYVICCKRKFFDRTRLVDHLHSHLNPDHFKCKICGKAMSDRIRFDRHMLRVHRANEVVRPHCCDVCRKSFAEAYVLRIHKLSHLPEEEKKFPCSDCGKKYGSEYVLNQHRQVVHFKRFVKICYICGKAISSSAEFKIHMNKHEGIPLPIINCDVCGLRLNSERSLKLHKETQHPVGGKKDHPCPMCDRISPTARALKKHIVTMHEKGHDHKCNMCEKAFRRSDGLKEHMASQHTGAALYTCTWCPQTFNSNGNMYAHRKKIHPKEWVESKLQKYSGNIAQVNDTNN